MRILGQSLQSIAASITAVGVIAGLAVVLWDVREDACNALLWTIQRDLFAAQQMQLLATELAPSLTESEAITMNKQVLKNARESIQTFQEKKAREKKECGF